MYGYIPFYPHPLGGYKQKGKSKMVEFICAPVVQWIEHRPPKPKIWVQLPSGALINLRAFGFLSQKRVFY